MINGMEEARRTDDSGWLARFALLVGLALGGIGGLGIGAVMFVDREPKVVATYCSPFYDTINEQWGSGGWPSAVFGWPMLVYSDGTRRPATEAFRYDLQRLTEDPNGGIGTARVSGDLCISGAM